MAERVSSKPAFAKKLRHGAACSYSWVKGSGKMLYIIELIISDYPLQKLLRAVSP